MALPSTQLHSLDTPLFITVLMKGTLFLFFYRCWTISVYI